jgi:hypothetical protein
MLTSEGGSSRPHYVEEALDLSWDRLLNECIVFVIKYVVFDLLLGYITDFTKHKDKSSINVVEPAFMYVKCLIWIFHS